MTTPTMIRKAYLSEDMSVYDGERAVVAKICVPVVDRDGEVVVPQGCRSEDFEKNPVVFYSHSYQIPALAGLPPVGKCVSLKRTADALIAKTVFAERPANHPKDAEWLPDTLLSLYQQGVLKGFSIGFLPIDARAATKGDKDIYGPNCKAVYSKWNMTEYSVAPIPCNQEAVAMAVSKGIITRDTAKSWFNMEIPTEIPAETKQPEVIIVPPKRKVVAVYQETRAPAAINVDAILKRWEDRKCGVLYSD